MADLELIRNAIDFAMEELCDGYLDMPSGCDGCPLCYLGNLDDDGNVDCRGEMFRSFIKRHGRWVHKILLGEQAWFCSECKTIGSPTWKRCPVCEAKMDEEVQNER